MMMVMVMMTMMTWWRYFSYLQLFSVILVFRFLSVFVRIDVRDWFKHDTTSQNTQHGVLRSLDKTIKSYFQLFFVIFSYCVFCLFAISEQQCSRLIQKMENTRHNIQKITICVVPATRQAPQSYFQLFSIIFSYFQDVPGHCRDIRCRLVMQSFWHIPGLKFRLVSLVSCLLSSV